MKIYTKNTKQPSSKLIEVTGIVCFFNILCFNLKSAMNIIVTDIFKTCNKLILVSQQNISKYINLTHFSKIHLQTKKRLHY